MKLRAPLDVHNVHTSSLSSLFVHRRSQPHALSNWSESILQDRPGHTVQLHERLLDATRHKVQVPTVSSPLQNPPPPKKMNSVTTMMAKQRESHAIGGIYFVNFDLVRRYIIY